MKEETYIFDDGTEPTVRRLPRGCDYQGRFPEAAEAATEVGVDDDAVESLGRLVLLGLGVVCLVGAIAFVVGYFI
jgi:hypothetical protein